MITIISLNYNNSRFTIQCVDKTCSLLKKHVIQFQYLVVDNCSTDESFQQLTDYYFEKKEVEVIKSEKNGGFGYGNNYAVPYSKYNIFWFLNSDAWCVQFENIDNLIRLVTEPSTGLVSTAMMDNDGTSHPNGGNDISFIHYFLASFRIGLLFRKFSILRFLFGVFFKKHIYVTSFKHNKTEKEFLAKIVSGASFFCHRNTYQALNGFDTDFFLYDEDTDLCVRAINMGKQNYIYPEIKVKTVSHSSTSLLDSTVLKKIKKNSRLLLIKKHFQGWKRMILIMITHMTWRLL